MNPNLDVLYSTVLKTTANTPMGTRLLELGKGIKLLIESYAPAEMIVESVFFGRNITACIKTAEIIGMLRFIAAMYGLAFHEYPPLRIKKHVTGHGKCTKDDMLSAVKTLYKQDVTNNHIADAMAVGYVHYTQEA